MAYATPPAQATNDVIGATQWNKLVTDIIWVAERGSSGAPQCRVHKGVTQTFTDNTLTPINWDTNDWDNTGIHSTSINPSRFTAPVDGTYMAISGQVYEADTRGIRYGQWSANGSGVIDGGQSQYPVAVFQTFTVCVAVFRLTAGQYTENFGYQNVGGLWNLAVGSWAFFKWIATYS